MKRQRTPLIVPGKGLIGSFDLPLTCNQAIKKKKQKKNRLIAS